MKVNKRLYLILGLVCLLNLAAHLYFYPQMPDIIPTHWGADGTVNGYGPRWTMLILAVLPLACLALFAIVPRMDPKGANYEKFRPLWQGFIIAITLLMAAVSWLTFTEAHSPITSLTVASTSRTALVTAAQTISSPSAA